MVLNVLVIVLVHADRIVMMDAQIIVLVVVVHVQEAVHLATVVQAV